MKTLFLLFLTTTLALAAPAYSGSRQFTQPDGTVVKYSMQGDEHMRWIESNDGEILVHNEEQKCLDYAMIKDGNLRSSGEMFSHRSNNTKASAQMHRATPKVSHTELMELYEYKRSHTFNSRLHRSHTKTPQ